jgi:hypothetical protein
MGRFEVRLMHVGRGHSRGDSVAWLPQQRVLFAGDLVENRCAVYAGDGYLREWSATLDRLAALDARALLPGRGAPLLDPGDVLATIGTTRAFLDAVWTHVADGRARGLSRRNIYETTRAAMAPTYGSWPVSGHVLPFDVCRATSSRWPSTSSSEVLTMKRKLRLGMAPLLAVALLSLPMTTHAGVAVVVGAKSPATKLSAEQTAQLFLAKVPTLPGAGPVVLLDQAEGSAIRDAFYTKVAGKTAAQVKALWARLVFSGAAQPPKAVASGADVKKQLAEQPNAIGYIDSAEVDPSVKVLLVVD